MTAEPTAAPLADAIHAAEPAPRTTGAVVGWPRLWLRLEGLAGLVAGVVGYINSGGDLLLLIPLVIGVDLSMAGYLAGSHVGAIVYNVAHNWFTGLLVLALGLLSAIAPLILVGWVLIAHVGIDRLAGYGLKYAAGFGDTHLGWIGRRSGGR